MTFHALLLFVSLTLIACMPKVEEDEVVPVVTISSSAINGTSANTYITLQGTCPNGTYVMRVMVMSQEYTIGEAQGLTMQTQSGVPVGTCTAGTWYLNYPVPNPTLARPITFKVKAKLNDGRSSLDWATRTVNFTPISSGVPGFVIASVGTTLNSGILTGTIAGDTLVMHSIGGEAVGGSTVTPPGNILDSAFVKMRTGLHGVILE